MDSPPPQEQTAGAPGPILVVRGLVMDFPGVRALDRVDLDVHAGEVHALMGENGAGKSTLINILSGVYRPGAGSITLGGREFRPSSPRHAEAAGLSTVHQEIDLVPTMTVAENICLCRQRSRFGMLGRRGAGRRAAAALARVGISLDTARTLGELSIAMQQMVAIARALDVEAGVLVLDEPTSSLDSGETRELFTVIRRLRGQGVAIIYVSHFLDEVYEISDRITVLRNGAKIGSWPTPELSKPALIEAMTGRAFDQLSHGGREQSATGTERTPVLVFENLSRARAIAPAFGSLRAGEALGLAGLLGSGRSELARLIFGADTPDRGQVRINGQALRPGSVSDAVAHGVAFAPEDRQAQGLVLDLTVRENIILALQARRGALRPIRRAEQNRLVEHYIRALQIKAPGAHTPVGNLSGGNQQKVLLARWLATRPKVLILDEPTRGIDVGARAQIESLVTDLRRQGLAIVFISAELDEIVRTCDRVLVLRDRRVVGELAGGAVAEAAILARIAGPARAAEAV